MKFRFTNPFEAFRPKVKPDPAHAEELERRRQQVSYVPESGFHRDRVQKQLPSLLRKQAQ